MRETAHTTKCICDENNRKNCTKCFGSGLVCTNCQNTGRALSTLKACDCNVASQNRYFFEMKHYHNQSLIRIVEKDVMKTEFSTSKTYNEIISNGYRRMTDGQYINHFALLATHPSYFIQNRFKELATKALEKGVISHGFVYVPAVSIQDQSFLKNFETINKSMDDSRVYIFLGLTSALANIEFGYVKFIANVIKYPFFIFTNSDFIQTYSDNYNMALIDSDLEGRKKQPLIVKKEKQ